MPPVSAANVQQKHERRDFGRAFFLSIHLFVIPSEAARMRPPSRGIPCDAQTTRTRYFLLQRKGAALAQPYMLPKKLWGFSPSKTKGVILIAPFTWYLVPGT